MFGFKQGQDGEEKRKVQAGVSEEENTNSQDNSEDTAHEKETNSVSSEEATPGQLPKFGGVRVVEILEDGKELRDSEGKLTHVHAKLENRTTAHVPISEFDDSNMSLIPSDLLIPKDASEDSGEDENE